MSPVNYIPEHAKELSKEEIKRLVKENNVQFIRLQFVDINGQVKNIAIPSEHIDKILENFVIFDDQTPFSELEISMDRSVNPFTFSKETYYIYIEDLNHNKETFEVIIEIGSKKELIIKGRETIYTTIDNPLSEEEILSYFSIESYYYKEAKLFLEGDNYFNEYDKVGNYLIRVYSSLKNIKGEKYAYIKVIDRFKEIPHVEDIALTFYDDESLNEETIFNKLVKENKIANLHYGKLEVMNIDNLQSLTKGTYNLDLSIQVLEGEYHILNTTIQLNIIKAKDDSLALRQTIFNKIYLFFKKLILLLIGG